MLYLAGPLLDIATTIIGVFVLGYQEQMTAPKLLFSRLGILGLPVFALYETLLSYAVYRFLRRLRGVGEELAGLLAGLGPLAMGIRNIAFLTHILVGG